MFFKVLRRNSQRSRKENWLYFTSLVISILAFYTILSIESQDVMVFLKTMESQAVDRFLLLIPPLYALSLFFLFFMVYFANKYQLRRRSRELGLYQMLGMKRGRLFRLLVGESLLNSLIALAIGLPVSFLLTEIISVTTAKVVGMGLLRHQFRISLSAVLLTVTGFIAVQLAAIVLLSAKISRQEPGELITLQKEKIFTRPSSLKSRFSLWAGVVFLLIAYVLGAFWDKVILILPETLWRLLSSGFFLIGSIYIEVRIGVVLLLGIIGTFLLFYGLGALIGRRVQKKSLQTVGLQTYTARQLEENVFHQSATMAIASLLVLLTFLIFAFGVYFVTNRVENQEHSADFTIYNWENTENNILKALESEELTPYIETFYPMDIKMIDVPVTDSDGVVLNPDAKHSFSWGSFKEVYNQKIEQDDERNDYSYRLVDHNNASYFIPLSSYNQLLSGAGKEQIILDENQLALYSFTIDPLIGQALKENTFVVIDGREYKLLPKLYDTNPVADRAITLSFALIAPDELYNSTIKTASPPSYWNMHLKQSAIKENGMMQSMLKVETILQNLLADAEIHFESYLKSIGRALFFNVAGSYICLYMGNLFLIIANTVIGLKFLMEQESTKKRYKTLLSLGADEKQLKQSIKKQINWLFALTVLVAVISGIFGVLSLMKMFPIHGQPDIVRIISLTILSLVIFILIELCYIGMIRKAAGQQIQRLVLQE